MVILTGKLFKLKIYLFWKTPKNSLTLSFNSLHALLMLRMNELLLFSASVSRSLMLANLDGGFLVIDLPIVYDLNLVTIFKIDAQLYLTS